MKKRNYIAKHMNKVHKPKRIEDKRYKQQLKEMEKDIRQVRIIQKEIYETE